jgi:hypothetical protein
LMILFFWLLWFCRTDISPSWLQGWHLSFLMTKINLIFLDDKVGKLGAFWLQVDICPSWWLQLTGFFSMIRLIFEIFLMVGFISSSSCSMVKTVIYFYHQLNDSFFVHNLARFHWGFFFCNKSKYMCNALWLDDMHAFIPCFEL